MNNRTTYALLMRSEEKGRDLLETGVYAFCVVSAVFAIWQFAQQPVTLANEPVARGSHVAPKVFHHHLVQFPAHTHS